jgi:hypothetical protein
MRNITSRKIYKIIAVYIAMNLLAEMVTPVAAYALTSGPLQAEFQSFEPAGTSEMVDLFTGDFNYNIPLMTVPGPNGGYPINLAYHAGVGMEQEASWVGLGWNVNVGSINRALRGVPDDFSGEKIVREMSYRPSTAVNFQFGKTLNSITKNEILGFDALGSSYNLQMYYNSYRGVGYGVGLSLADAAARSTSTDKANPFRLNLSANSDGVGVNVDYQASALADKHNKANINRWFGKASLSWSTAERLNSISLGGGYNGVNPLGYFSNAAAGVGFSKSSYVPVSTPEMTGFITMLGYQQGRIDTTLKWKDSTVFTNVAASISSTWVKYNSLEQPVYGYMYADQANAIYNQNTQMDYALEKDGPVTRQTKHLPVPSVTYDVYSISGQGVGGSFRPYRSDIGIYSSPKVTSTIYGGNLESLEFGQDTFPNLVSELKVGGTIAYSQSQTYSGAWFNHWWLGNNGNQGWNSISDYQFYGDDDFVPTVGNPQGYEAYYLKHLGEQTAVDYTQLDYLGGTNAVRFQLNEVFGDGNGVSVRPELNNDIIYDRDGVAIDLDNAKKNRTTREKRIISDQQRTNATLTALNGLGVPANIYSVRNSFPATSSSPAIPTPFTYSGLPAKQIGEYTVLNGSGNRYIYGIPVYNHKQQDVTFAIGSGTKYSSDAVNNSYNTTAASLGNSENNTDQFYASNTLPAYATSHLLTQILSADYVDITGNGPSDDDLGYYVKFNYVKDNSAYKWRSPYKGATVNKGELSNVNDDRLSYMYGERDVYYLHSVETKTHVACFVLQTTPRSDARGATGDVSATNATAATDAMYALDRIELYSKAGAGYGTASAIPVKTAHFVYETNATSTLCQGIPNAVTGSGKLTLKQIYFTYLNNKKGKLSPYTFDYVDNSFQTVLQNPAYDVRGTDRWGIYKRQGTNTADYLNEEVPYTDQKTANRNVVDQSAAAWTLKKITLPSGSQIEIKYEADDYKLVQDKKAMQMCRIVGLGQQTNGNPTMNDLGKSTKHVPGIKLRVYFELEKPIPNAWTQTQKENEVYKYLEGVDETFFSAFMKLKKHPLDLLGEANYDYVDGFASIKKENGEYGVVDYFTNDHTIGYFTIQQADITDNLATPSLFLHPFQKAAVQHLSLKRPDLFDDPGIISNSIANLPAILINSVQELPRSIAPYSYAILRGWCSEIDIDITNDNRPFTKRPSFIRLNSPDGIKVGGGHRVKEITSKDGWSTLNANGEPEATYGIRYTYRLPNGESSGVAAYEPMVGNEENPHHMPIRYSSNKLILKDEAFFTTEPLGESYFPAPVVGYSRVIVESIVGNDNKDSNGNLVTKTRSGKTVYQFYTAADYPVKVDKTDLQKTWFPIPIWLPFVGSITYNNRGFSQGFSVVLNDMHGKLKSVATYPYSEDLSSSNPSATRYVTYDYSLGESLDVLTGDGLISKAKLGETYDFSIFMDQHSNETYSLGIQHNIHTQTVSGITLPTLLPQTDISRSLYRSITTAKVVFRTGVLTKVTTLDEGTRSEAKNLLFDAETGVPLLTSVNNEFEKPVYSYGFAAQWSYPGMGGAYKNINKVAVGFTGSNGTMALTDADKTFISGDEVLYTSASTGNSEMLWVESASSTAVVFMKRNGGYANNYTLGNFRILRSGYRNLQTATSGAVVALSDPSNIANRQFPLFISINQLTSAVANTAYSFNDCFSGQQQQYTLQLGTLPGSGDQVLYVMLQNGGGGAPGCETYIRFPDEFNVSNLGQVANIEFYKYGNVVKIVTSNGTYYGSWIDTNNCFNECMDDILDANAGRLVNEWTLNFNDAGMTMPGLYNPFVYSEKGVWRSESNYLFQTDRKQSSSSPSSTNIAKDGTYEKFVFYNWNSSAPGNKHWSFISDVTAYSPYGYMLETRDALGIYSASLIGYNATKSTAAAQNARYFEIGFDAFEDYAATQYSGHGHLNFVLAGGGPAPAVSSVYAHTGSKSLAVQAGGDAQYQVLTDNVYTNTQQYFEPKPGADYNLSVWVRADAGASAAVEINNGVNTQTFTADPNVAAIEGWKRIDVRFTAPASGNQLTIKLKAQGTGSAYFDDIRVQPFSSAMVTYVYDPLTHWLLAELDNRNFATIYNYDEQGAAVQVKQETERGIFTISTGRSNIKR